MKHSVSAVVPVFNEEKTLSSVVDALLNSKLIDEVICINDGSTDKSRAILKSFGRKIVLINLRENHGKGYGMGLGVKRAKGDVVVFFDGDLKGLNNKHIKALIYPLIHGRGVFGVVGILQNDIPLLNPVSKILESLSGQRAYFRKDLLPHVKNLKDTKRGAELYLNSVFKKRKIVYVTLHELGHVYKFEKTGFTGWTKDYLLEGFELGKALYMNR